MAESKDQFMSQKVALICGVSGQDGSYLAALLLSKGYSVFGTSRDVQGSGFFKLASVRHSGAGSVHFDGARRLS